jgi:hypothetical protein
MNAQPTVNTSNTPAVLPARYFERVRARGWMRPVSPLMEYRLLRPWYNKPAHVALSLRYMMAAMQADAAHSRAVDAAEGEYGANGPLIAGGLRDHWPQNVKEKIRTLASDASTLWSASVAHWQAAGRKPYTWRRLRDAGGPSPWPPETS